MKTPLDPRHTRRQKIIQELFAWNANRKTSLVDAKDLAIVSNLDAIDALIKQCAPEWEIEKTNPIDLAILRLAVYELVFEHKEPPKVIIDEAIELAKEFGNESSPGFINGALGKALTSRVRILKIIADKLGVETERLVPQANLQADLNATDLEISDLVTTLEHELNLPVSKTDQFATIGDLLEFVEEQT